MWWPMGEKTKLRSKIAALEKAIEARANERRQIEKSRDHLESEVQKLTDQLQEVREERDALKRENLTLDHNYRHAMAKLTRIYEAVKGIYHQPPMDLAGGTDGGQASQPAAWLSAESDSQTPSDF